MKRCVVTGATGLVGSHLLPLLGEWEIHATRHRDNGGGHGARWHDVDLAAPDLSSLPGEIDALVYLAQSAHFREFPAKASDIFAVNVAAVQRSLDYALAAGCRTFVLASTGGVYQAGDAPAVDTVPVAPRAGMGYYSATRLCAEMLAEQYAAQMSVVVLRFFFVYGPGQAAHMLVPRLVESVRSGTPITLAGSNGIRINPTYVDDAAAAVARAMQLQGRYTINVAGPETVSLRELAMSIGNAVGRTPIFTVDPASTPRHLVGDTTRMRELLHAPSIGVDEGIRRLVASVPGPRAGAT